MSWWQFLQDYYNIGFTIVALLEAYFASYDVDKGRLVPADMNINNLLVNELIGLRIKYYYFGIDLITSQVNDTIAVNLNIIINNSLC